MKKCMREFARSKVKGVLPIVQEAAKSGIRRVVVPGENAMEAAVIPGITVWGVNCLNDLLAALNHPELETEKVLHRPDFIFFRCKKQS